uniref:Sensor protein KdpD n=1 Tax=Rathayibacter rathayi TaxID=33887 RepID=KDPD_RATRA|nr:RecName: Full=Sensor protein KdpD [Rathayibacter rathayi]AAB84261.1 protein kinase KdpD [Rathayibacter rathayi]CAA05169.1 protein kinase [Rathayibacter rathayi]
MLVGARVLLGAPRGVGKTFTMLEEAKPLRDEGVDVVVAVVETHGRAGTAAALVGLEVVPRLTVEHRGVVLTEMDVAGVIVRRAPQLALVDELAHTNASRQRTEKRWQDVEAILDAGIDVMSTVNIQHIESLTDVVHKITGAPQRETIPDEVLRAAREIEVIDVTPVAAGALASGLVYPAERIDAALSNYFRLGNLTGLRELALLWLADEVDSALKNYRAEQGIDSTWETRERVVVALTGGPEGDSHPPGATHCRPCGRGELLAVHVTGQDGFAPPTRGLWRQRSLVESLGGSYHQVIGDDIALVEFARAANATQLVIGVSRRGRLARRCPVRGSVDGHRESGNIDVHIVNHAAAGGRFTLPRMAGGALTVKRRLSGLALTLILGPLITAVLVTFRSPDSITSDVLTYQVLVVLVALVGGIWPALLAAVLSGITLDYFLVEPLFTVTVDKPLHLFALALYITIAMMVSYVVDQAARRTRVARRSAAESELLATIAGSVLRGDGALQSLVSRTRKVWVEGCDCWMPRVRPITPTRPPGADGQTAADHAVICADGEPASDDRVVLVPVGERATLELHGADLDASERRLLAVIAAQIDAALEHEALSVTAREVGPLAETDRVRTALLSAVSHDLRRPFDGGNQKGGWLALHRDDPVCRRPGGAARDRRRKPAHLSVLVTDLLDVSRVQAGVLGVTVRQVDVEDVLPRALDELGVGPDQVVLDLDAAVGPVLADPGLLQRVLVNLLANALRFSPEGAVPTIDQSFGDTVQIRVTDHGPGIAADRRDDVFVPFQRLGDTDNSTGLGLGLALSKGFTVGMGGELDTEDTPGGGLTMVVTLPVASADADANADRPGGSRASL